MLFEHKEGFQKCVVEFRYAAGSGWLWDEVLISIMLWLLVSFIIVVIWGTLLHDIMIWKMSALCVDACSALDNFSGEHLKKR